MSNYPISKRYAFYGLLPPGSPKPHLAFVLNNKNALVRYCYCTSAGEPFLFKFIESEFFYLDEKYMTRYFPKESDAAYIYLSESNMINISLSDLENSLDNHTFTEKELLDEERYNDLIRMIKKSYNLSERFKRDLIEFLED
jgi:hypothetical protein